MNILRLLAIILLCTLTGCLSMPWAAHSTTASIADDGRALDSDLTVGPERVGSGLKMPNRPIQQTSLLAEPSSEPSSPTDISASSALDDDAVLGEIQAIGLVDPDAAQQLVTQLQSVAPSLRPLAAQHFRSSWQLGRELAARSETSPTTIQPAATHSHHPAAPVVPLIPFVNPVANPAPHEVPPTDDRSAAFDYDPSAYQWPAPVAATPLTETPRRLPATTIADALPREPKVVQASYEELPRQLPPVAAEPNYRKDENWREAVDRAATRLAAVTPDDPRSTRDAYQHARLRLLHLASGDSESALAKIPGLTPTEQSYWSNQLFALSTLLDHEKQPDDGQRAALASGQLADAMTKLGELSALSIRNLAFCKEVFGYGDYESHEEATFKPGQKVTLYAEMENFRSESTEKGYHTSLATSYEVLDQNGNRVEGGEFATVDDYCKRHRRDFYIEYTFELPSRIYASEYQLRLMIRDRLSGKIGKATVDFEIKE